MKDTFILSEAELRKWAAKLTANFTLFGPILKRRGQVVFEKIDKPDNLCLDYSSTMTSPRNCVYPPRQTLFEIDRDNGQCKTVVPEDGRNSVVLAIHPCDMQAISVLDRTFLGDFKDLYYSKLRQDTITVVLNCNQACDKGFCVSMGTGPFLQMKEDFDVILTAGVQTSHFAKRQQIENSRNYLVEFGSEKGRKLIVKAENIRPAERKDFKDKSQIETQAITSFKKCIDTAGLPELLMRNLNHPVYKQTAEGRCLGCTNCTMVCPTCYCYNMEDCTSFDLKVTQRKRHWDSCQELNFAKVHGGNFRSSREARLRQFVTHKLASWVEQYDCFGCVGCGRCMTWCPTGIDLTEMAKKIQQDDKRGRAE